jgi:hypothetical protein
MLLFRSEEDIEGPRGAVMTTEQLHELAQRWYGNRLDPEWRARTVEQSQAILDSVGLTGAFWRLA